MPSQADRSPHRGIAQIWLGEKVAPGSGSARHFKAIFWAVISQFESSQPSQPVRLHRVILNVPTTVASAEASLGAIRPERTASVIAANTSGASGGVQAVTFDREEEYDQAGTSASECRRLLLGSAASDREDLVRDVLLPLHADRAINDPRRPFTSGRLPEIECRTLPST